MKSYFFLFMLCIFVYQQEAFSETSKKKIDPAYATPAIEVSRGVSEKVFLDPKRKWLNCPMLFNNSWSYPNGSSIALCDDAQLACIRYGLILQKMKTATGPSLAELKKVLVLSKDEVKLRLQGCELILDVTWDGTKTMQDAAGYPSDAVDQYYTPKQY